jgi:hypothetical protein
VFPWKSHDSKIPSGTDDLRLSFKFWGYVRSAELARLQQTLGETIKVALNSQLLFREERRQHFALFVAKILLGLTIASYLRNTIPA